MSALKKDLRSSRLSAVSCTLKLSITGAGSGAFGASVASGSALTSTGASTGAATSSLIGSGSALAAG